MDSHVQQRVASATGSERTNSRDIETIVEEFTGDPGQSQELSTDVKPADSAALTPRAKSSLAKKLAKSLGFHSQKDSTTEAKKAGSDNADQSADAKARQSTDRGVHFTSQAAPRDSFAQGTASSGSSATDKPAQAGTSGDVKYISPFQSAQPSGVLADMSGFYSPTSSFNSVASSSKVPKALSASLDEDVSQLRKSRMGPGGLQSQSGDLEHLKAKASMLDGNSVDERNASGVLSAKSRRSSAYSLKSMDDASDSEKELSPLARANSESPWGPKRSGGSFTSGVSGRARGDSSPRLRGAYAEIQVKDMDQQLSVARMKIVQLTAEVQSSKQTAQHHEERTAALQAQLNELRQVKDGSAPMQSVFDKLDSARSQASSLSEQLATAKHNEEIQHKENVKLQKSLTEQSAAHEQAEAAVQQELAAHKAASKAAQDKLEEQVAALQEQCNSYEVVLKNKDSKGQLMSLQQTLRQEIHAKIGAQTAEESAKRKVSDLQGTVQELQEALDKEVSAHREAQSTLEEAYRHRNGLDARVDELEAALAKADTPTAGQTLEQAPTVVKAVDAGPEANTASEADSSKGKVHEALVQKVREMEAREQAVRKQEAKLKEATAQDLKENQTLKTQVAELEKELAEANKRLTRIDEADKRLAPTPAPSAAPATSADPVSSAAPASSAASPKPAPAVKFGELPSSQPSATSKPMSSVTSFRRLSVDDDRVDAVISHLEGMNTTLKSLRSEGGDLEPFLGSDEDMAEELERERTNRIIAQQTANQERLQARASAAESASLRRQLNELAQQMEQEKKKAAAAKLQSYQLADTESRHSSGLLEQRDVDSVCGMSRAYSNASEGHAADKAALQGFAKTRDVASSPLKPAQDEQSSKANEGQGSEASQQQSGSVTPASQETADSSVQADPAPAGEHPMEKNYTDTIESLLSELWKERLARQRAELNATDAEDKLKAYLWAAEPQKGEGVSEGAKAEGQQAKAMADLDASLMQRLEEDSATNHKLLNTLKDAQGKSQSLQQRIDGIETALKRQDSQVEKLQAGAKRHMEASLRQSAVRKDLQQASHKEDKLRKQLTNLEAELNATRRLQRDQAAHAHASNRQSGDELVSAQAQLAEQQARLTREADRRRNAEALLQEGLQVQNQILLGLQELVGFLQQEGHLAGAGSDATKQPPNLDQLIALLQRSQASSSSALSRSGTRQSLGRQQSSPTRLRSGPSQRGTFGVSGTFEEGSPPVELGSSPPGTANFSRPAWLVPGSRTEQRAAARKQGKQRSSSPFSATASRYMNPRAAMKAEAEPERMFRARSVPRGMSPQRSRVADYIRIGSPVQRGGSTQVLPATSSDMVSRDRELISAQHDRAYTSTKQQGFQDSEGIPGSKPISFRSLDSASQINKTGSITSYDQLQVVQSGYADSMQIPEGGKGAMANWSRDNVSADRLHMSSSQSNGRHTHQE